MSVILPQIVEVGGGGLTYVEINLLNAANMAPVNLTATTDPTATNDNSQGYTQGSIWLNTVLNREWTCLNATIGAAIWSFGGAAYSSGGYNPPGEVTQLGASTALMAEEGNINRQIVAAGISPGATAADNVMAVFSLPANAFDGVAGTNRGITVTAQGSFAANGDTKRIKIIVNPATAVVGSTVGAGGTTIADTGAVTTNGGGWSLQGNVFKYGIAGSNTQIGLHQQAQVGAAVAVLLAPSLITATESGAILIAITANCTTTAADVLLNFTEINAMN